MFEQRIANLLEPDVSTGWAFKDQDTGASREVDIYKAGMLRYNAHAAGKRFIVRWVVIGECKNYQWPWVALTKPWDKRPAYRDSPELAMTLAASVELGADELNIGTKREFKEVYHAARFASHVRAVQLVKLNKKSGGWETHSGDIFNELTYPLAKATSFLKSRFSNESNDRDERKLLHLEREITLIFPAIFISSDIFAVSASEARPTVNPIRHVILERRLSSESISGLYRYDVVNAEGVVDWYNNHVLRTVKTVLSAAGLEGKPPVYSRSFVELPQNE